MALFILEEDCFLPNREIVLKFNGPNRIRAYQVLKRKMREIWEVDAVAYWEREFRWDVSGDPREFVVKSYVDRSLDRFTKLLVEVFIQGYQPSDPTKDGRVEIRISGILRTTFGSGTFFEDARNPIYKGLMWIYYHYFYQQQKNTYIQEWCYNRMLKFKKFYQEMFNMAPPEPRPV